MRIGSRDVGPGHPTFIIAEAGSNHSSNLRAALMLVSAAADAGADAVKFQLWDADRMYSRGTQEHESARKWQLPVSWLPQLQEHAASLSIEFLCSAFDVASLEAVDPYVNAHKVASLEATWGLYLAAVKTYRKPILLSTGGASINEVSQITARLEGADVVLLQATLSYPASPDQVDLRAMLTLGSLGDRAVILSDKRIPMEAVNRITEVWAEAARDPSRLLVMEDGLRLSSTGARFAVGYSDHTTDPTIAPCAAVALGACVIEKHLKLGGYVEQRDFGGVFETPDWSHAIDVEDFRRMVRTIRATEVVLGTSEKRIRDSERPYLKYRRGPLGLRGA